MSFFEQDSTKKALIAAGAVILGGAVTYYLYDTYVAPKPAKRVRWMQHIMSAISHIQQAVKPKTSSVGGTATLAQFDLSTAQLTKLVNDFHFEMDVGLARDGRKSSLKMLHSFVGKPTGNEKGSYYALDLGGNG